MVDVDEQDTMTVSLSEVRQGSRVSDEMGGGHDDVVLAVIRSLEASTRKEIAPVH